MDNFGPFFIRFNKIRYWKIGPSLSGGFQVIMKDSIAARICLYTSLQAKGFGPLRSPNNYSGSGVDRKPMTCIILPQSVRDNPRLTRRLLREVDEVIANGSVCQRRG